MTAVPEYNPFEPGMVVELTDATQLAPFEELAAAWVRPNMALLENALVQWQARPALREQVRPTGIKFFGPVSDIKLQVMDDPKERYLTARDRGHTIQKGENATVKRERMQTIDDREVLGFTYLALAKSSGHGVVGQVQAELWYCPSNNAPACGGSEAVQRVVTKPKLEREKLIELDDASVRITLDALRARLL